MKWHLVAQLSSWGGMSSIVIVYGRFRMRRCNRMFSWTSHRWYFNTVEMCMTGVPLFVFARCHQDGCRLRWRRRRFKLPLWPWNMQPAHPCTIVYISPKSSTSFSSSLDNAMSSFTRDLQWARKRSLLWPEHVICSVHLHWMFSGKIFIAFVP